LSAFQPIERAILFNRGIRTNEEAEAYFLEGRPSEFDPFLLSGMDQAVARVLAALRSGEKVVIYGDYDADGVTATALLVEALQAIDLDVEHYIPNRFDEGYGLNDEALAGIRDAGAGLVVTVDCGVRAIDEIDRAKRRGLDVVVTDHHHPGSHLPPAVAIINPKQPSDKYPYKDLAGVGLAYKLARALYMALGREAPASSLDLVAIGTVADLAPLSGENRILVRNGLEQLNNTQRPGLRALIEIAGYKLGKLDAMSIGFGIGPRLNAAGRLTTSESALGLLLEEQEGEAARLARVLEDLNRERQRITHEAVEKIHTLGYGEEPTPYLIFVVDSEFNEGIVGLTASRLVDELYRPTIVAVRGESTARASGRSIPEFHLTKALEACGDLLQKFGGHSRAAGFTVQNENIEALQERLTHIACERLADVDLRPTVEVDAIIQLPQLDWSLMDFMGRMGPCGNANPLPVLAAQNVTVLRARSVGAAGNHLKLTVRQADTTFDAIAFRMGDLHKTIPQQIDIAFHLTRNEFWEIPSLELNVLDIRPAGSSENMPLTAN
jgi:single-stranded-DNA-specific exonuclease